MNYEQRLSAVALAKAETTNYFLQNKPNQTQFFASFVLPMLPICPNQAQPVVSLSNLSQTSIAKRFQQNNQLSTIDNQSFPPTPAQRLLNYSPP